LLLRVATIHGLASDRGCAHRGFVAEPTRVVAPRVELTVDLA
jgi:hypothetical protein